MIGMLMALTLVGCGDSPTNIPLPATTVAATTAAPKPTTAAATTVASTTAATTTAATTTAATTTAATVVAATVAATTTAATAGTSAGVDQIPPYSGATILSVPDAFKSQFAAQVAST